MELATVTERPPASEIAEGLPPLETAEPVPQPAETMPIATPEVAPVTGQDRLLALDTLRGVAVLGILLMNILFFGLPMAAGFNPDAGGESTFLNRTSWFINQILFEGKMRCIFS